MMEAKIALAMVLAHFDIEAQPGYTLRIVETLTLKPGSFRVRVQSRARGASMPPVTIQP